jgi:hypothetical protein
MKIRTANRQRAAGGRVRSLGAHNRRNERMPRSTRQDFDERHFRQTAPSEISHGSAPEK